MSQLIKKEKNYAVIEFSVPAKDFNEANAKAYVEKSKKYSVPGFRKGKAPRKVIENYYGEGVFYEDAINIVFPKFYAEAIEELGLNTVAQPEIDVKEIGKDKDLVIEATVAIYPEFDLPEYKGLSVEVEKQEVTDEKVMEQVEAERQKNSRLVVVEREAQNGDSVVIDFKGFVDDVAFAGGEAKNHTLELGSHSFIDNFEDQIVGKKAGDEFDVNVTFPAEYHAPELAGKPAVFKIVLHEVKEKQVPEIDDDFVSDISEFDTLDEYKANIKEELEKSAELSYEDELREALVNKLTDSAEIDVPEPMIEEEVDQMLREFDYRMRYQGLNLETYLNITNMQIDDLRLKLKDDAVNRVKSNLLIDKIAEVENLEISDEDAIEELNQQLENVQAEEADRIRKSHELDGYETVKMMLRRRAAVQLLVDNCSK